MTDNTRNTLLLGGCLLMLVSACSLQDEPCLQPGVVSVRLGAYHRADTGTAIRDSLLPRPLLIAPDAGIGPAVFLYGAKVAKFSITLNPQADSARWVVQPDSANNALRDTIVFRYNRRVQFLSNTCGYTYFYSLQSLTNTFHALDSVRLGNADVTNDANTEHIRLYY